jgi:HEAT repeat protein/TolA-binding protein
MKMRNDGREMKSIKTVFAIVAAVVALLAAGAINQTAAQRKIAPRVTGNAWSQQTGSTPQATSAFTAARDLIDDAQWAKAEQAFSQYTSKFPKEDNLDAAMYWTAYSEYQLKKFDICKQTIDKMLKAYEKTSWKQDAEMLLAQLPGTVSPKAIAGLPAIADIAAMSSAPIAISAEAVSNVNAVMAQSVGQAVRISAEAQERIAEAQERMAEAKARADERAREAQERTQERLKEAQERFIDKSDFKYGVGVGNGMGYGVGLSGERLADDDPCEFKIVVLISLTESDPQRGISAATDWLKPNSGQTPPCRRAALRVLARNGGKTALPTILGAAQNDGDIKVRQTAISLLGSTNDESVIDPLRDFALNAPQPEINEAAMFALSQHTGARAAGVLADIALSTKPLNLRKSAISRIADRQGEPAVDALFKIYDSSQDLDIRKSVISGLSRRRSERAGERLLSIAKSSESVDLRKAAISAIGRRGGTNYIDALMSLYDSEKSEEIKDQILNSLAYSNDQKVIDKLISIARNPQTPIERKRRIVMLLAGKNKNPAVIQFFEELLKQ